MTLKKRFEEQKEVKICGYQKMIDSMPEEDKKTLEQAWKTKVSQRTIVRVLRAEGYKTSNEAIMAHFGSYCKCVK